MGRKRQTKSLTILMNGHIVGELRKTAGVLTFEYAAAWLHFESAVPLSLAIPLSSSRYRGDSVYRFFDNLLPDSRDIRDRMQARLSAESRDPFDLLAEAGADCIGAIQLVRQLPAPPVTKIEATAVSDEKISHILRDYQNQPLGMEPESDEFRISLAGQQEKSAFLWHEARWKRPVGATPTSHIFKLPIGHLEQQGIDLRESVENEWICLRIANEFGLPTPEAQIAVFDGIRVLIVERFDRQWSADGSWLIRIPQEDICQALDYSPGQKYESDGGPGIYEIMNLLLQSSNSIEDRETFIRSQILFWVLAAPDGHAKNFSIHLEPGGRFRLAPFYDILSAYPMLSRREIQKQRLRLAMAPVGKNKHYHWHYIQRRHWISTAERCGFPKEDVHAILIEFAEESQRRIENVRTQLPDDFPQEISDSILNGVLDKCTALV